MASSFTSCYGGKIYGKVELEIERRGQSTMSGDLVPTPVRYRFASKTKYKRHYELIRALLMEMIYIHFKILNQIGQTGQFSSL